MLVYLLFCIVIGIEKLLVCLLSIIAPNQLCVCIEHVLNRLRRIPFRGRGQNCLARALSLTLTSLAYSPSPNNSNFTSLLLHIELRKHSPPTAHVKLNPVYFHFHFHNHNHNRHPPPTNLYSLSQSTQQTLPLSPPPSSLPLLLHISPTPLLDSSIPLSLCKTLRSPQLHPPTNSHPRLIIIS
jgi:hypothetical protein